MKELVISLKKDTEEERVRLANDIKKTLEEYKKDYLIDVHPRDKFEYTENEKDVSCYALIKLVDPEDKFLGAFVSWFAYNTSNCREIEPNVFKIGPSIFSNILSRVGSLSCFMSRISGIKKKREGFEGKIELNICDFYPSVFNKNRGEDDIEVEPIPKHAKYFNQFAEFNYYDF